MRDLGDARLAAGLLLEHRERALHVGVRRQPDRDVEADRLGAERVVAQDAGGEPLVGDDHALVRGGAQDGEVQPHVLDDAVVVLERDPVADPQRLRDREHDPGHRVGEHLAGGEADDRGDERAGGEQAGRELGEAGELRQRDRDADQQDPRVDQAAEEAQARVEHGGDLAARDRGRQLVAAALEVAVEQRRGDEREQDRERRRDPVAVVRPEVGDGDPYSGRRHGAAAYPCSHDRRPRHAARAGAARAAAARRAARRSASTCRSSRRGGR